MDSISAPIGRHQDQEMVRKWDVCSRVGARRSRGIVDTREGARGVLVWHWVSGQGQGEGDLLG